MAKATTVSKKGQVTIPAKVREELGIEPSDRVMFHAEDDRLVGVLVAHDFMAQYGSVDTKKKKTSDLEEVRKEARGKAARKVAEEGRNG